MLYLGLSTLDKLENKHTVGQIVIQYVLHSNFWKGYT